MLKKTLFYWFSQLFNMGTIVKVGDIPGMGALAPVEACMEEGQSYLADGLLRTQLAGTPLGEFLAKQGPHILRYELILEWNNPNIMEWYQYPTLKATLTEVRFMNQPAWLVAPSPIPA